MNFCPSSRQFTSTFPDRDMKNHFFQWFKHDADKSSPPSSFTTPESIKELKALAHGPLSAHFYTACIVNGVRFVVHSRGANRSTQNSGVVSIDSDGVTWYGLLKDIVELKYLDSFSVVLFCCKWFKTSGNRLNKKGNIISIDVSREWYADRVWYDDQLYILATQAKQVFYLDDPSHTTGNWKVVEHVHHRKLWDHPSMSVTKEIDVLHDTQSSDYDLVVDSDNEVGESSERQDCNFFIDLGDLPMVMARGEGDDDDGEEEEEYGEEEEEEYDDEDESEEENDLDDDQIDHDDDDCDDDDDDDQ